MVKKRPSNALLKASDAKIMLRRLLMFHAFCILCMKCFHLSFVIRCSVLVAVSLLVSQERLFVMQASDCAFQGIFRRIRHSLFSASSTLYFHLEFVIWNFIAWNFFQKLLYSSLLLGLLTSRAHSNWLQYGWSVTWPACCFSSFTSVGCIHQLPAFQKSLHSSRNGSSRLLYAHWMMFLDRFSVINSVYFLVFLSCKTTTYELGCGHFVLFSKSKIQRICVSGGCTSQIFAEVLWCLIWMRDICLIAFFFGVFFHQNYRCFCGLLKLVRRTDCCEPWKEAGITLLLHFFSAYEFFN